MKILLVGLKNNPQVDRVREEGEKRGHTVDAVLSSELYINASVDHFEPKLIHNDLSSYDLIYLWAATKRRWEWYATALYLNEKYNTKIVNNKIIDPSYHYYLTSVMDYWKLQKEGLLFPKTAVLYTSKAIDAVIDDFNMPAILRGMPGRKGKTVSMVNNKQDIIKEMAELDEYCTAYSLREFIPNDGDIRVFVIDYKAFAAMKRTPKEGDFRSNISQGGSGAVFDIESNPEIRKIAERAAELTQTEIAGVDIMIHSETQKPYILEINPGPQFTGLEEFTGVNAAGEIIKYFEKVAS